jgi:hypothetical protein
LNEHCRYERNELQALLCSTVEVLMNTTSPPPSSMVTPPEQPAPASGKTTPLQSGCFSNSISEVQFGDIAGEHDLVKKLYAELNLPFFPQPPAECVPKHVVLSLLQRIPILIRKERGHTFCIGNVRLYRLGLAVQLDDGDSIRAVEYTGSLTKDRLAELKQGLLIETFLMPAIFGRRALETEALNIACARVAEKNLDFWAAPDRLARLYREIPDRRE